MPVPVIQNVILLLSGCPRFQRTKPRIRKKTLKTPRIIENLPTPTTGIAVGETVVSLGAVVIITVGVGEDVGLTVGTV